MNWTYTGKDCNNSDIYEKGKAFMIINRIRKYLLYFSDENNIYNFIKRDIKCK